MVVARGRRSEPGAICTSPCTTPAAEQLVFEHARGGPTAAAVRPKRHPHQVHGPQEVDKVLKTGFVLRNQQTSRCFAAVSAPTLMTDD